MKLILLLNLMIITLVTHLAFANTENQPPWTHVNSSNISVEQQPWTSLNSSDVITIEKENASHNTYYAQIYVNKNQNKASSMGIRLRNCGDVTNLYAGSTALCHLANSNYKVSFSAMGAEVSGYYSIIRDI